MRHEAGLANFDTSLDMKDLFAENIKQNAVGRIIEQHAPSFAGAGGGKRQYHGLTRGWIANELFRRVDPAARTIGEYLREEISGPLNADVIIGVKQEEMARVAEVEPLRFGDHMRKSMVSPSGRSVVHSFWQLSRRIMAMAPAMMRGRKDAPPPPFAGRSMLGFFNDPDFAKGETPSANANCSARGLAKVAAMMAAGGSFEGRQYLSPQAWQAMHEHPLEAKLGTLLTTRFTQGGVDRYVPCTADSSTLERQFNEGREGFFGWMGLGGSIFQWHPELEIGFAFVPTSLHILDFLNERGKRYQAEVLKCVQKIPGHTA
jgi:CubicO group peptidase (beta-lactamase class C family)